MDSATFTLDPTIVQALINQAVQDNVLSAVENISQDPVWLRRVEHMINQTIVQETIMRIGSIDINTIIAQRVDEALSKFRLEFKGISDQSTQVQLTLMDDTTVVENILTAKELHVVDGATINNLAVKGSINTDNQAWDTLANNISEKTLAALSDSWKEQLIQDVTKSIQSDGINFTDIKINDQPIFTGSSLSSTITESSLQSIGTLQKLKVNGEALIYDTLVVNNGRIGINTETPESALSIWDEEVTINIGKFKANQAYIGTSRPQGLSLGVNRIPQIDIDASGLTTIKKLRVGVHMIAHAAEVPGWSGTRGDIVFNANPKADRVFAWLCLGAFHWQVLKSAE